MCSGMTRPRSLRLKRSRSQCDAVQDSAFFGTQHSSFVLTRPSPISTNELLYPHSSTCTSNKALHNLAYMRGPLQAVISHVTHFRTYPLPSCFLYPQQYCIQSNVNRKPLISPSFPIVLCWHFLAIHLRRSLLLTQSRIPSSLRDPCASNSCSAVHRGASEPSPQAWALDLQHFLAIVIAVTAFLKQYPLQVPHSSDKRRGSVGS